MGWFSHKKEENNLKEIPTLPEPPSDFNFKFPKRSEFEDFEVPNLEIKPIQEPPMNQDYPINKDYPMNQKSSYLPSLPPLSPLPSFPPLPPLPTLSSLPEIKKEIPSPIIPKLPQQYSYSETTVQKQSPEQMFIRLDKFQATLQMIKEIKSKIEEVEYFLAKTKEINKNEQKELEEWSQNIQAIKARMDFIDKNLLNKLE